MYQRQEARRRRVPGTPAIPNVPGKNGSASFCPPRAVSGTRCGCRGETGASGRRKRRGWAAVPRAAASRSLHEHTRPCCPTRWGASAAASTRVCSHLRGRLVHHCEERQTGVRGRAAAFRSSFGHAPYEAGEKVGPRWCGGGRGPRSGSCPGFPGQLPSEEPLTGPTALSEAACVKVRVAKARGFRYLRDVQKAFCHVS